MWKEESGFTLIEVLISILIISIAIIPISYVFTNVTKDTVKTQEMLEVSKLGAKYLENIKARNIVEYRKLFTLNSSREGQRIFDDTDDLASLSLPDIPDKYKVRLSYNESDLYTRPVDSSNNEILPEIEGDVDVDCTIDIDNNSPGMLFYDKQGTYETPDFNESTITDRIISISASDVTNRFTIRTYDGITSINKYTFDVVDNAIGINIGNKTPSGISDTTIEISSSLNDEIKIYVFEEGNDFSKFKFIVKSGQASISRNLKKVSDVNVNLVAAKVEVLEKSTDKLMLELKGSVTNE